MVKCRNQTEFNGFSGQPAPLTDEQKVRAAIDENGGKICNRLKLFDFPDTGRGIATDKPIYTFEKVIDIPQSLVITAAGFINTMCELAALAVYLSS